jgi:DNA-binding IclR family transcriptional regulator
MSNPIDPIDPIGASPPGGARPGMAASHPADTRYLVPGLVRGLEVLQLLSGDRRRMGLSEIAAACGITRSSAYRLLYTLAHLGFVTFDAAAKTYALGPQVLRLGYGLLAGRDLVEVATPHLLRLRDRTGWSAHLGELLGRDVVYLSRVATRRQISSTVHVGAQLAARSTSMGRVLLSHLPEAVVRELYQDETADGFDLTALIEQLARDREQGAVVQNASFEPWIASVAAPVCDVTGAVVAAINISAVALLTDDAELNGPLKAEVVAAARAISRELGGRDEVRPRAGSAS